MDSKAAAAPVVKKRRRAPTAAPLSRHEEREPSRQDLHQFWTDVRNSSLQEVTVFCAGHPELLSYWKEREDDFYAGVPGYPSGMRPGPLYEYAGLGSDDLKIASMAILFGYGIDVPEQCMLEFLSGLFSPDVQSEDIVQRGMERIMKKLDGAVKIAPRVQELAMYAAALHGNMRVFQHFFPRTSRKTLFDSAPGDTVSVLQAVLAWPDPKIRRDLASEIMAKSSTAYITMPCNPLTALEQAASMPDPEMVTMLLVRLKTDGTLGSCLDTVVSAVCKCIQKQAGERDLSGETNAAYAAVQTQLVAVLDERHIVKLRTYLHTLKENAIKCKASADPTHPLHQQATSVLALLSQAMAVCVSSVKYSSALSMHVLARDAQVTRSEEAIFEDKFHSHLRQINMEQDTQIENAKLKEDNKNLEAVIKKQAMDMRLIQAQAVTISRLRKQLAAEAGDVPLLVGRPAQTELFKAEQEFADTTDKFLEDMECRLLELRLAVPPVTVPMHVTVPKKTRVAVAL